MKKFIITLGIFIGMLIALSVATYADAASYDTGWLDADTFTSAGTGVAFTNPSNAISSNNAYAQSTINDTNNLTQFLSAKDFDISIPANMTITGIEVRFERNRGLSSVGATINDYQVQLVGCTNTSFSYQGTSWPTSDAYQVYGSSTYDWDADCTEAQIEDVAFGFGVRATFYDNGCASYPCSTRARVDHMQVKIHYEDTPQVPKFIRWFMPPFILGAQANECTFVTVGATTTATCAEPTQIANPTQDLFYGIVLTLAVAVMFVLALFRKANNERG